VTIDLVVVGGVNQTGEGQPTARQVVKVGVTKSVNATINNFCVSRLHALLLANHIIPTDEAKVIIAGALESVTNAAPSASDCFITAGSRHFSTMANPISHFSRTSHCPLKSEEPTKPEKFILVRATPSRNAPINLTRSIRARHGD
jgi:acetyl-CoA acetyltransferase